MARLDRYGDRYMDVWQPAMFEVSRIFNLICSSTVLIHVLLQMILGLGYLEQEANLSLV